ncbi:MAG: phosphatidylserine decarboxylase family protein [Syntrophorhabdales bacterium]
MDREKRLTRLPVAKEGLIFILPSLFLSFLFSFLGVYSVAAFTVLLTLFFLYFFRNPRRPATSGGGEILSAADGRVMAVEELFEGEFLREKARRISIFMSISDVHINRAPCEGSVERVEHRDGRFKLAFKKGIDEENERNYIVVRRNDEKFLLVQIAGFLVRRIVCYVREHDLVEKGEPVGMIAFGSRVDVYMPTSYRPAVEVGQKVKSGLTILAKKGGDNEKEKA